MKVSAINNISFGRRLTPQETQEFQQVQQEAKQLVGQTGKSIFIVHDACLPQTATKNTGVSNLAAKESQEFFRFMKPLLGFNIVEVLPQGQVANSKGSGLYCAYSGTALSLGNHQINPELLTTEEFGRILKPEEFAQIVQANTKPDKETIANYDNVMAYTGEQNKMLKIAHQRFLALDESSPLKQKYNEYIQENAHWLDIPRSFEPDPDYFKFRQFLADEHLKIGKEALNKEGIKLLVVKNTLLQKALEAIDTDFSPIYGVLKNNTTLMFSNTGNAPAKLIKNFSKKAQKPVLKAAYVEESFYVGQDQLDVLVSIKSKNELIADVIALLQSPAKNVVSALQSGGNKLHGVLKTLSER